MHITKNTAITLRYKLMNNKGLVLEEGKTPLTYLHGGYQNIFEKVENALEGKAVGFATTIDLTVVEAFGERDESLVQTIPKSEFPPGIKVGGQIERTGPQGESRHYFVTKIKGPVVLLDGNHPYAGIALRFALKVVDVRAASPEEIAHGHVHGEHGHHH